MRILIAEDNEALGRFLAKGLGGNGCEVEVAADGEQALRSFLENEPDLLILDLDLPGLPGMELLRAARRASLLCPALVLSGSADGSARTGCLDEGADDYLAKPFSLTELRARCGALLRRQRLFHALLREARSAGEREGSSVLRMGALALDRLRREVGIEGVPVRLTNTEYALLERLLLAGGNAVSRAGLREAVWSGKHTEANVIDVHVGALRRKLGLRAPAIETVRGAGFRINPAGPAEPPPGMCTGAIAGTAVCASL